MNRMSDPISRQAAIDAIERTKTARTPDGEIYVAKLNAEMYILMLPSEQRWIPCSEQLPKKSGQYYVSGGDKVWVCEFLIIPNFAGGWCNNAANPVVQAWMPLPEPYAERKDNELV